MRRVSRLFATVGSAVLATLVLFQSPALAATPGFPDAGRYHSTTDKAFFFDFTPDQSVFIGVTEDQADAVLADGSRTATHTTSLFINVSNATLNANDCYLIPAGDFALTSGKAALHTTVDSSNQSCAFPGQTNSLPVPFTVDVSWTVTSPVARTRNNTNLTCGSYSESGTDTSTTEAGSAVATITPIVSGSLSAPEHQFMQSSENRSRVAGVLPDGCSNSLPGLACEATLPNAGDYVNSSTTADANVTGADGSIVLVGVRRDVQTYQECGQPITNDFQVFVNDFGGPASSGGCFLLGPSDFSTNGVQSATLNTVITESTPTCNGQPASMPFPLTLDLVWTPTSPTAQSNLDGRYDCGTYRAQTTSSDMGSLDSVTGTVTPLLAGTVTMTGSLRVMDSAVVASGAKPAGCLTVTGLTL
jgi:hypothetical protein